MKTFKLEYATPLFRQGYDINAGGNSSVAMIESSDQRKDILITTRIISQANEINVDHEHLACLSTISGGKIYIDLLQQSFAEMVPKINLLQNQMDLTDAAKKLLQDYIPNLFQIDINYANVLVVEKFEDDEHEHEFLGVMEDKTISFTATRNSVKYVKSFLEAFPYSLRHPTSHPCMKTVSIGIVNETSKDLMLPRYSYFTTHDTLCEGRLLMRLEKVDNGDTCYLEKRIVESNGVDAIWSSTTIKNNGFTKTHKADCNTQFTFSELEHFNSLLDTSQQMNHF